MLEIGLVRGLRSFCRCSIHRCHSSLSLAVRLKIQHKKLSAKLSNLHAAQHAAF
jgi:hypothetical protein